MINSSQDLLLIILSFCVLWFTVFLCWLLYQAAKVLRNANNIIENVTAKLELISDAVHYIQDKIDGISSNVGVVGKMASGLFEKLVIGKLSSKFEEKLGEDPKTKRSRKKSAKK